MPADDADGAAVRCEQLRRRGGGGVPLGACMEFPSGRSTDQLPEPSAAAEAAARRDISVVFDRPGRCFIVAIMPSLANNALADSDMSMAKNAGIKALGGGRK